MLLEKSLLLIAHEKNVYILHQAYFHLPHGELYLFYHNSHSHYFIFAVHVKEDSPLDKRTYVEALARETIILRKRVAAAQSRILLATSFLPCQRRRETLINWQPWLLWDPGFFLLLLFVLLFLAILFENIYNAF